MKKIAILSQNLKVGGIQRSLINFLNQLDYSKCKVDCYLYEKEIFYQDQINENVNIIFLKPRLKIIKFIPFDIAKIISKCKLKNEEYDFVIDYDGYQSDTAIETILSNSKLKICWIHQNLLMKAKEEVKYNILHFFMKSKYKYFNRFAAVSKGVIEPFEILNNIKIKKKCIIIPNYIDTSVIFEKAKEKYDLEVDKNKYNFATVGRICKAKGHDILINYLHTLKKYRKDFHFYLIGDGVDRSKIENQISKLHMNDYITLLGNQSNPFKYLKLMDGFIMTSRYEGQGMVLLEAKSLGLELFMTKNLEQYNEGLVGYDDLLTALKNAKKKVKKKDDLKTYNDNIKKSIKVLFEVNNEN